MTGGDGARQPCTNTIRVQNTVRYVNTTVAQDSGQQLIVERIAPKTRRDVATKAVTDIAEITSWHKRWLLIDRRYNQSHFDTLGLWPKAHAGGVDRQSLDDVPWLHVEDATLMQKKYFVHVKSTLIAKMQ